MGENPRLRPGRAGAGANSRVVVLAVADGAGSRRFSGLGAELAVGFVVTTAQEVISRSGPPGDAAGARALAEAIFGEAVDRFLDAVPIAGVGVGDADEFGTTLSVAVLCDSVLGLAAVGDGFTIVRTSDNNLQRRLFLIDYEPKKSGGDRGTTFLTSPGMESELRVWGLEGSWLDAVLMSTDGMAPAFLSTGRDRETDLFDGTVDDVIEIYGEQFRLAREKELIGGLIREVRELDHGNLVHALENALHRAKELPPDNPDEIAGLLRSLDVAARTRDDKTVVLAVRS
jgi:hypothetical protein